MGRQISETTKQVVSAIKEFTDESVAVSTEQLAEALGPPHTGSSVSTLIAQWYARNSTYADHLHRKQVGRVWFYWYDESKLRSEIDPGVIRGSNAASKRSKDVMAKMIEVPEFGYTLFVTDSGKIYKAVELLET